MHHFHNYLVWNRSLWLLVIYFLHKYFHYTYHDHYNWLKWCSKAYLGLQTAACCTYQCCELDQPRWPKLMINEIVLKFRNYEVLKHMLNILIDIRIIFLIRSLLLKGLHTDTLNILDLLWYVKTENRLYGKHPKTIDTKRAQVFTTTVKNNPEKWSSTQLKE